MATSSGVIPPRAQIPVAVVLAIFFAVVLVMRFSGGGPGPGTNVVEAGEEVAVQTVSVDEMKVLLSRAAQTLRLETIESVEAPSLSRDPFVVTEERFVELISDVPEVLLGEATQVEPIESDRETVFRRQEVLAGFELTATLSMGETATAIISGQYLQIDDEIYGFRVVSIGEREVTLEDSAGRQVIRMVEETLQ